jgi:hypothetical protein
VADAKLSGSLLARKDALPATGLAQRVPAPAATGRTGSSSPTNKNSRSGPLVHFALAVCGVAVATTVGVFWFVHATAQTGPVELRSNPAVLTASVAAWAPTDLTTHLQISVPVSSEADTVSAATVGPARPDASLQPAIAAAIAYPAVSSAATTGAIGAPEPSAAVGRASAPAITDPGPTVASAQAGSPTPSATIGAPTIPAAAPEPDPAAAVAPISPQPDPITVSKAPVPETQLAGARIPAEEVAALLARGDALFDNNDIASARLFYERAAEGGDAQAALRLGETYDSAFLEVARLNNVRGDAAAAARWYQYARELGAAEAEILLTDVMAAGETAERPKEINLMFQQFLARQGGR